jgi:hypothetical protein
LAFGQKQPTIKPMKTETNYELQRAHATNEEAAKIIRRLLSYADRTAEKHPQAVTHAGQNARVLAGIFLAKFEREKLAALSDIAPKITQLLLTPNDSTWQGALLGLADNGAAYRADHSEGWILWINPISTPPTQ